MRKLVLGLIASMLVTGAVDAKNASTTKPASTPAAKAAAAPTTHMTTAHTAAAHMTKASAHRTRISKARAERIALRVVPGKVLSSELEKEHGAWRYSFDIKRHGQVREVGVSAKTGRVLENVVDHDRKA